MSYLIERLRFLGDRRREELIRAGNAQEFINSDWIIEWQAADEIERLCDIVETQEDALKEFKAEIERLRAVMDAAEEFKEWWHEDMRGSVSHAIDKLCAALEALEVDE